MIENVSSKPKTTHIIHQPYNAWHRVSPLHLSMYPRTFYPLIPSTPSHPLPRASSHRLISPSHQPSCHHSFNPTSHLPTPLPQSLKEENKKRHRKPQEQSPLCPPLLADRSPLILQLSHLSKFNSTRHPHPHRTSNIFHCKDQISGNKIVDDRNFSLFPRIHKKLSISCICTSEN